MNLRPSTRGLAALRAHGWRVLPIPSFHPSAIAGVPPVLSFFAPEEWIAVPPEAHPASARRFKGREAAKRWATERLAEQLAELPLGRAELAHVARRAA